MLALYADDENSAWADLASTGGVTVPRRTSGHRVGRKGDGEEQYPSDEAALPASRDCPPALSELAIITPLKGKMDGARWRAR